MSAENKALETKDKEERTFTYEDIAAVTVNAIRPICSCVDDAIRGGLLATLHQNDEAYHELKLAIEDLKSIDSHVDAAMTALGHAPEAKSVCCISLGGLLRAALA